MHVIPRFPNFKKLDLSDKEAVEHITMKFAPYSDFTFLSLWSYNTTDDLEISLLHGNLVVKFRDYITNDPFFSFIGDINITSTIETLLVFAEKSQLHPFLKLVPEEVIKKNLAVMNTFQVKEDEDNFDYILSVDELSTMGGKKYYDKRNLVNRFLKYHPVYISSLLTIGDTQSHDIVRVICNEWQTSTSRSPEDTATEFLAIERTLRDANEFELFGLCVYVEEKPVGFTITEIVNENYAVIAFQKGLKHIPGIYAFTLRETARELKKRGITYINYEQDMGIPGLKKAKKLWHPVKYLKKFNISREVTFQ